MSVRDYAARLDGLTPIRLCALQLLAARQIMAQLGLQREACARDRALPAKRDAAIRLKALIATQAQVVSVDDLEAVSDAGRSAAARERAAQPLHSG